MKIKYNKRKRLRTVEFSIGDGVTIKVPRSDRGPCDLRRIPGVIVRKKKDCYTIRTKFGVLKKRLDCKIIVASYMYIFIGQIMNIATL